MRQAAGAPNGSIRRSMNPPPHATVASRTLAFDVGGSGIKMVLLNELGKLLSPLEREKTPKSRSPEDIIHVMKRMAESHRFDRISVGLPGVVCNGVVRSAPNLSAGWTLLNAETLFQAHLGKPVRVANDADVQGFGAIAGRGVELLITLGTGVGSALFIDGRLVPNLEIGRQKLGDAGRKRVGLKRWRRRVKKFVGRLDIMFNFDHLYLGGGNAARLDIRDFPANVKIVANTNGLVGGVALWSADAVDSRR